MGLFSSPIKTLDDLFTHTLQDIYYAENQIAKNLPTMVEKAENPELKAAFQKHLAETQGQAKRLEQVFQMLGKETKGVTCAAMDGILSEAKEIMSDCADGEVRDAAMLSAAQAVEHYEITRYGTLIAFAAQLGRKDVGQVLQQTLAEEKNTDQILTRIAEARVNKQAA
ncbi:MAG: ferritin-like domain-containing protein [Acetobacteraceae bacterium]|nr:ferritin-like domain-containing protein [Acetobacteraceae bacterium]